MRICPSCGASYDDELRFCPRDGELLRVGDDATVAAERPKVLGSYRLLDLLGEGGMGRVYRAEHLKLGRKVALKVLRPEFAANPEAVKRFFAEARSVNQVAHENIVEVTDFVEGEEAGRPTFLIMELLQGESLRARLDREPVPALDRTLRIAMQIASALGAAHEAGIVHRDLKPDNVFLTERSGERDHVKILDFGIAKLRDPGPDGSLARTAVGAVLGTPEYMSPEQAEAALRVDHRADVYALGVILYEMVAGRKPITGRSTSETLIKQLTWMPPAPGISGLGAEIPAGLEALIMRALSKQPEDRPRDMREFRLALEALLQSIPASGPEPVAARPETTASWALPSAAASVPSGGTVAGIRPDAEAASPSVAAGAMDVGGERSARPARTAPAVGQSSRAVATSAKPRRRGFAVWLGAALIVAVILGGAWFALREAVGPVGSAEEGDSLATDVATETEAEGAAHAPAEARPEGEAPASEQDVLPAESEEEPPPTTGDDEVSGAAPAIHRPDRAERGGLPPPSPAPAPASAPARAPTRSPSPAGSRASPPPAPVR